VTVRAEAPAAAAQESPKPLTPEAARDSSAKPAANGAAAKTETSGTAAKTETSGTAAKTETTGTAAKTETSGAAVKTETSGTAVKSEASNAAKPAAGGPIVKPAPATTDPAKSPVAKPSTVKATPQPGRSRASGPGVQVATAVEERTSYHYNTLGRRDPFESLVESFVGDDVGGNGPVDIGGIRVVGIVWGNDPFALVEDGRGNSGILRRGDKVMNGFVEQLQRDAVVVRLAIDGQSQTVSIPLIRKEDNNNASR
jgi:hypothetical protein